MGFLGCKCCGTDPCNLSGCSWVETTFASVTPETVALSSLGGSATGVYEILNELDQSRGNSPPSRRLTIETTSLPASGIDTLAEIIWIDRALFNPSEMCALDLTFCFEARRWASIVLQHGDTESGVCFFVRQGGVIYRTLRTFPKSFWSKKTQTDFLFSGTSFTSYNLFSLTDPSAHPDFTTTGSEIEFGVGLVLKASASAGVTLPKVSARFDNACITADPCSGMGCSYGGCEQFQTSGFAADQGGFHWCRSNSLGTGPSSGFSVDISEVATGNPVNSLCVGFDFFTAAYESVVTVPVNLHLSFPGTAGDCRVATSISVCVEIKGSVFVGGTEIPAAYAFIQSAIFQNGKVYFSTNEGNPGPSSVIYDLTDWVTHSRTIYQSNPGGFVTYFQYRWGGPNASADYICTTSPSETPDFSQPFEFGFFITSRNIYTTFSGHFASGGAGRYVGRNEIYLDNICVSLNYLDCFSGSFLVDLDGLVSLTDGGGAGCQSSLVSTINSALNAVIVCSKVSGSCLWRYQSLTQTVGSHSMKFKVEVFVTESDDCYFVDGYVLITVESKVGPDPWVSESAVFQISQAFDVSSGPGDFNFDSLAHGCDCFELSATGSALVELI